MKWTNRYGYVCYREQRWTSSHFRDEDLKAIQGVPSTGTPIPLLLINIGVCHSQMPTKRGRMASSLSQRIPRPVMSFSES
jgi:hypothetical protein